MEPASTHMRTRVRADFPWLSGLLFTAFGLALTRALYSVSDHILLTDIAVFLSVGLLLILFVTAAWSFTWKTAIHHRKAVFSSLLVVWCFLLVGEDFFEQNNSLSIQAGGTATSGAYEEVMLWVLAAMVLVIITLPRIRELARVSFEGSRKWITLFAILSVASVSYAPEPLFSLIWAFKLCLVTWLLLLFAMLIRDQADVKAFLMTTVGTYSLILLTVLVQAIVDPSVAFRDLRLSGIVDSTNLSEKGGIVLLVSLILSASNNRKRFLLLALFGGLVMTLGGGKASIVAAVAGGAVFYLMRKKTAAAVAFLAGVAILAVLGLVFSPTGSYIREYSVSGQGSTLTGRTELWTSALPEIKQSLVLGHGYMASKFITRTVEGIHFDASHLHNSFLEVLYNNGVCGLLIIVIINLVILGSLFSALRSRSGNRASVLAAGLFAIYVDLFIDGMFRNNWGGRPSGFFMLFLALLVTADVLRRPQLAIRSTL